MFGYWICKLCALTTLLFCNIHKKYNKTEACVIKVLKHKIIDVCVSDRLVICECYDLDKFTTNSYYPFQNIDIFYCKCITNLNEVCLCL